MILTVNLNPNIDRYVKLEKFVYGGLNRVSMSRDDATSKGINISSVLKTMGIDSICTGFMYEQNGKMVTDRLAREGLEHDYIWQPGYIRLNLKVFDAQKGKLTEINEKGVPAKEDYIELLREKLIKYADKQTIIVFTGSMPPDCPVNLFAELIEIANKKGSTTILDAEGEVLKQGVLKKPYAVKINKIELESFVERKLDSEDDILMEASKIIDSGVRLLLVSLGAEGSVIFHDSDVFKVRGLKINAVSPTGAGDSMVAALIKGIMRHASAEDILRSAAAASTGTAMCEGTRLMTMTLYNDLFSKVEIEKIAL